MGGSSDERASEGFIDAKLIEGFVPERDADYYFCGFQGFMVAIYQALLQWGIRPAKVHFEFFEPRSALEKAA